MHGPIDPSAGRSAPCGLKRKKSRLVPVFNWPEHAFPDSLRIRKTHRDLIGAPNGIPDDIGFRFEVTRLGTPGLGDPRPTALSGLSLQFSGQGNAFVERPQRPAKGPLQVLVERDAHDLRRIGMADMTSKAHQLTVVNLPHDAMTVGTGK